MADEGTRDWHFWSVSSNEASNLGYADAASWIPEPSFFAPTEDTPSCIPVYRFYSAQREHHFWSTNQSELVHPEFVSQGVAYWVFRLDLTQPTGTRELVRYVAKHRGGNNFQHFWTPTPEAELLDDWDREAPIGYVYPSATAAAAADNKIVEVHRWAVVYPSWTCHVVQGDRMTAHSEDIPSMPESKALLDCKRRLYNWATEIRKVDPRAYRAEITRK